MSFAVFVNGLFLMGMAVLMELVALGFPETRTIFFESAVMTCAVGACLAVAVQGRLAPASRLHAFLLTGSVWITAATAGAMPLWLWGLSPIDAFFESMSGITTTGSTVMSGLDDTTQGILLWRALLQWIGGIGFIVAGIWLLPIMRVGGMQLFRTESSERADEGISGATNFAGATIQVYLGLTALCITAYMAGGMTEFDAALHAMTTVSTGGYSTSDSSFGVYDSALLSWTGTLFMLAGALPFAWYIGTLRGAAPHGEQVRALVGGLGLAILALTGWRVASSDTPVFEALTDVAFNVVSVVTTTGYATTDYTTWGPVAVVAFFLLTAVGGCTGSTAGGAKMMRWIILLRATASEIRSIHTPHGLFPITLDNRTVRQDVLSGVMAFFFLYFGTILCLAIAISLYGIDMATSLSGALTAVANVGPGIGDIVGPAGNFSRLPDGVKWLLSLGMYAGRLELMTVYVLFTPAFWHEAT